MNRIFLINYINRLYLQPNLCQIWPEICPLIFTKTAQRKTDKCPEMNSIISAIEMVIKVMYL